MPTKKAADSISKTTAEKTTPSKTASNTPKTMDIHPVGTAPTVTTSKPVIVGNKSMASDPMLSANKSQSTSNTTENGNASGDATTAPVISRHEKTISPLTETVADESLEQVNDAVAKSVEAITIKKTTVTNDGTIEDLEPSSGHEAEASNTTADEKNKEIKANETPEPAKPEPEPKVKPAEPSLVEESTKDDPEESATPLAEEETASQEKTAEQVRQEQIEALIQKKTYAVPIDKTGRRRHNAVLALLLTVIFAVIVLNFLLDFGVITMPGAPSTDFF